MNKSELSDFVAAKVGLPKSRTAEVVDAVFDAITNELANGPDGKVTIAGFGTWKRHARAAKNGTNPITNAPIHIPAKKVAKFKPGKGLADSVAG